MEQLKDERKAQDEKMAEFESRLRGVSSTSSTTVAVEPKSAVQVPVLEKYKGLHD